MKTSPAKKAASAMAELYVWSAIAEILEGGTAPRSRAGQKAASRMIAASNKQAQRCLRDYDKHIEEASP